MELTNKFKIIIKVTFSDSHSHHPSSPSNLELQLHYQYYLGKMDFLDIILKVASVYKLVECTLLALLHPYLYHLLSFLDFVSEFEMQPY